MSNSIKDLINGVLAEINSIDGIEASAVVSRNGLLVSANMPNGQDAETIAALTATMMGAAETALSELNKGNISQIIVESDMVKVVCVDMGKRALLVLSMHSSTEIEGIRDNLISTKNKIVSVLDQ